MKDPSPAIRAKAIAALGNFGKPSLAALLVPFLDADDGLQDAEAVTSLAFIGDGSLEERFISLLASPIRGPGRPLPWRSAGCGSRSEVAAHIHILQERVHGRHNGCVPYSFIGGKADHFRIFQRIAP